ncbi:MAG: phosphate uptake regulator PhoU [Ignisphaera sp.]|uniref:Phosphate uptake regulator PhoU n=1 Tax=Ignisphaera aggregans TaxID=334771 RepID=A0A7C4NMB6_9CREN
MSQQVNIRKIIRVGERSIGITIPKEWLSHLNVDIGSSVEVTLGPGYVLVRPLTSGVTQTKITNTIALKHDDIEQLERLIIASYIEGYDIITLDVPRYVARDVFYKVVMRLPGTIAMNGDIFKIKISVDELNTDLNDIINSMKTTISSMFDMLIEYFESGNHDKLKELIKLDDDLDRFHFLGMRTIKRTAFRDPASALEFTTIIKSLEHIGDTLDRVSNTFLKTGINVIKRNECKEMLKEMFSKVSSYVSKAINSLAARNINQALKVLLQREELTQEILMAATKCIDVTGILAISHEAMVSLYEAAEIAEISILRHLRETNLQQKPEK